MKKQQQLRSSEGIEQHETPGGYRRLPFPIGLKVWYALISETYTDEEVQKFADMVKMALLRGRK